MARLDMQARIGVDGTRWDQFIDKMKGDVSRFSRTAPRMLAAGFAGGIAGGIGGVGIGALRGGIARSFENARAARASAATIQNAEAGQMWHLAKLEQKEDLGGDLTGMVGTVGDLQRRARAFDQQAIKTLSMFGLDRSGTADPFAEAQRLFAKQRDPSTSPKIRGMIEQMFPATFNQRAREFGPEFFQRVRTEDREAQNQWLATNLHVDKLKRAFSYISFEGLAKLGGNITSWLGRGVGAGENFKFGFRNRPSFSQPNTGMGSQMLGSPQAIKELHDINRNIGDIKKAFED